MKFLIKSITEQHGEIKNIIGKKTDLITRPLF